MSGTKQHKHRLGAHVYDGGVSFGVWAPNANWVAVTGSFNNWQHTVMESDGAGNWYVDFDGAEAGQEYKFVIRNGDRELYKNDPRSLQLTTTSGGTSVIVDTAFDWGDDTFTPPPINEQVIYELHIGTFSRSDASTTGTFRDAIGKLDHLAELGINMIELMPVNSMSMDRGWGYATDYIYAIESLYGGREGLLEFVKAAHGKGIGVIMDVVYNHFGPDQSGLDLWQFDGWSENNKGGIYFYNDDRSETPWGDTRPDFGRTEVRDYILDSASMWLQQCRIDGLRVDSTIYIRNRNGYNNDPEHDIPDGWRILQDVTKRARKIKPEAMLIAEDVAGNEYITKSITDGGAGFKAQWELGFPEALKGALVPTDDHQRNIGAVCGELTRSYNGDPFQRIIYSDSHDSAANGGSRLAELVSPGNPLSLYARKRSLIASALVLTSPGVPMLFQGQEFNQGGSFNDWAELDWEQAQKYPGLIKAHSHFTALRRNTYGNTKGLTGSNISLLHTDWDNNVLAYHRWYNGGPKDDTVVIVNFNNTLHKEYLIPLPRTGTWQVRFNSSWMGYGPDFKEVLIDTVEASEKGASIKLAPYTVLILSMD